MLGDREVEVPKLTYTKYRRMIEVSSQLPGAITTLIFTPEEERASTALHLFDIVAEEIFEATAVLSEIDAEWLKNNASITEVADYLVWTYKRNNFAETVKNVRSLLRKEPTMQEAETTETTEQ